MPQLRITEIFLSLQGEGRHSGCPSVFVRLTGCPLRCHYCDTRYAFSGGEWCSIDVIMQRVEKLKVEHVCVTGGEPLAQQACNQLLSNLCDAGYRVSLETSGALDISKVDSRVMRVVDIKTPGSGEMKRNLMTNLECLTGNDQVKFVITSRGDYEWSRDLLQSYRLVEKCEVLFSPAQEEQNAAELAEWIVEDRLQARLQLQLHKLLWGDQPGR